MSYLLFRFFSLHLFPAKSLSNFSAEIPSSLAFGLAEFFSQQKPSVCYCGDHTNNISITFLPQTTQDIKWIIIFILRFTVGSEKNLGSLSRRKKQTTTTTNIRENDLDQNTVSVSISFPLQGQQHVCTLYAPSREDLQRPVQFQTFILIIQPLLISI